MDFEVPQTWQTNLWQVIQITAPLPQVAKFSFDLKNRSQIKIVIYIPQTNIIYCSHLGQCRRKLQNLGFSYSFQTQIDFSALTWLMVYTKPFRNPRKLRGSRFVQRRGIPKIQRLYQHCHHIPEFLMVGT
jgi:hypothetical protein